MTDQERSELRMAIIVGAIGIVAMYLQARVMRAGTDVDDPLLRLGKRLTDAVEGFAEGYTESVLSHEQVRQVHDRAREITREAADG
jgi:hypothetical protein